MFLAPLAAAMLLLLTVCARAEVVRFAVIVGTNEGGVGDAALAYAESDADKLARVLREMGNFHPANIALLRNEDGGTFRRTLVAVNDRIRQISSRPNTQTVLFVYYSGHADSVALRLRNSRFPIRELGQLVRGSAATFRMLVLDSCRSGALTRVKGGRIVAPFKIEQEPRLRGEGMAFMTASSASEDAQESDEIQGSFFTHGLVSGLMGAADRDGDGTVGLQEAYNYAYDATVRASSRSYAGVQHPTFQFDFRGDDGLVLTRVRQKHRGTLVFPKNIGFLVFKRSQKGAVVGELGPADRSRGLSLAPGNYFLRGRGDDYLLEGTVTIAAAVTERVRANALDKVEYARLVRKGAGLKRVSHGPEVGVSLRSKLPLADTTCPGLTLGYRLATRNLTAIARVSGCSAAFENERLQAESREFSLDTSFLLTWDFDEFSLSTGIGAGLLLVHQRFDSRGSAPARTSAHPFAFAVGALTRELVAGGYLSAEAAPEVYLLRLQGTEPASEDLFAHFALRGRLLVGLRF